MRKAIALKSNTDSSSISDFKSALDRDSTFVRIKTQSGKFIVFSVAKIKEEQDVLTSSKT